MTVDRKALAAAIRRARDRSRPEDVGLPAGQRRRVRGLRREELAMLAGISVDYVVRLEQARGPHPSTQVVGALARALRLDDDERHHLFRLAGVAVPQAGTIERRVRSSVLRLIDRFVDLPTLVMSASADVLAWNAMSSALLGDWSALRPDRRNQLRLRFLPDPADPLRSKVGGTSTEREQTSRQSVASLRAAAGRYPRDSGLKNLVHDLVTGSAEFAALWADTDAGAWRSHRKTVDHPMLGEIQLDCDTLHVPDDDQLLVVYSASPGTRQAESLALLRVVGTQQLNGAPVAQMATVDTTTSKDMTTQPR